MLLSFEFDLLEGQHSSWRAVRDLRALGMIDPTFLISSIFIARCALQWMLPSFGLELRVSALLEDAAFNVCNHCDLVGFISCSDSPLVWNLVVEDEAAFTLIC